MSKPNENEIKEMIEAGITLGRMGAAIFQGAMQETGSTEIARDIVKQYYKAMLNNDNPMFFFK